MNSRYVDTNSWRSCVSGDTIIWRSWVHGRVLDDVLPYILQYQSILLYCLYIISTINKYSLFWLLTGGSLMIEMTVRILASWSSPINWFSKGLRWRDTYTIRIVYISCDHYILFPFWKSYCGLRKYCANLENETN